jgi:SsrA-binding protein
MTASQADRTSRERVVATNRRAWHDYEIQETYEAGLVLRGTEVKSLREGTVNFKDSYAMVAENELWLVGCHISPYHHGTDANHDPERRRKLLLHRSEINRLLGKTRERGLTLVPLRLYFKEGRAKLELGLARGKKLHDKRQTLREKEARREMDRAVRARLRA